MHFQVFDHQWIWRFYSSVYEIMCEVISQCSCSYGLILRNLIATDCVLNFWIWQNIRWSYHPIGYISEWVTPILYRGHCSTTPAWHFTVELIQMQGIKNRANLMVCNDTFFSCQSHRFKQLRSSRQCTSCEGSPNHLVLVERGIPKGQKCPCQCTSHCSIFLHKSQWRKLTQIPK